LPLISMFFVTDNDVLDNSNCIFIYADNRKQSGDPSVNNKFRNMANAYPIILKNYGGSEAASYWKDDDFEVFEQSNLLWLRQKRYRDLLIHDTECQQRYGA